MKLVGISMAVGANLAVAPLVLPALKVGEEWLLKQSYTPLRQIRSAYIWVVSRTRSRGRKYVERWGYLGLAIFVAVPIPGSGAWTGSLLAHILGLQWGKSLVSISAGVIIASLLIIGMLEGVLGAAYFIH